jgi:crossover junction endodeoxyribonuclease RuvC
MQRPPKRVIAIDPGSVIAGWAIVDGHGNALRAVASGVIRCGALPFNERLAQIYATVASLCAEHQPTDGAIEAIYHQKNAQSALKLGHARAAAILAMTHAGLAVGEYEPSVVKKAVTGSGRADKDQVRAMVSRIIGAPTTSRHDETDAMAIGICHLQQHPQLHRGYR